MNKLKAKINEINMNITKNTKKDELIDKLILASFPVSILTLLVSIGYPPLGLINIISLLLPNFLTFIRLSNYNTKKLKNDIFYIDYIRYDKDFNLDEVKNLRENLKINNKKHNKVPTLKYGISGLLTIMASILGLGLTTSATSIYYLIAIYFIAWLIEGNIVIKSSSNYKDANNRLNLIVTEFENREKEKEKIIDSKETPKVIANTKTITPNINYEEEIKPKTKVLKK